MFGVIDSSRLGDSTLSHYVTLFSAAAVAACCLLWGRGAGLLTYLYSLPPLRKRKKGYL